MSPNGKEPQLLWRDFQHELPNLIVPVLPDSWNTGGQITSGSQMDSVYYRRDPRARPANKTLSIYQHRTFENEHLPRLSVSACVRVTVPSPVQYVRPERWRRSNKREGGRREG